MTIESPGAPLARSPLGHTAATLSEQARTQGELWRCVTCGQTWTAQRLETVAAYEVWAARRARGAEFV